MGARASWVAGAIALVGCASGSAGPTPSVPPAEAPRGPTSASGATARSEPGDPCDQVVACLNRASETAERSARQAEVQVQACMACPTEAGYRMWADLLSERGALVESRRVLLEGHRRFPRSTPMLLALARVERDLGQPRSAISHLARARRHAPEDPVIDQEYRILVRRYGNPEDRAEAELDELLRLAAGRYALDDADGALEALGQALGVVEGVPRLEGVVHHRRALVLLGRGDAAGAELEAASGLDVGASDLPPETEAALWVTRGEALMALGRYGDAKRATEKALERTPSDPLAWANLAFAQVALGNELQALDAFETAVRKGLPRLLTRDQLAAAAAEDWIARPEVQAIVRQGWP